MIKNLFIVFKMLTFLLHRPSPATVLVAELNPCHGELLHSWIKYCSECGIKLEIVVNKEVYNELQPFDESLKTVKIWPIFYRFYKLIFSPAILCRYKKIIFNSEYIYPASASVFCLLKHLKAEQHKILTVTHNMNEPMCCPAERIGLWERYIQGFTPIAFQYFDKVTLQSEEHSVKQFVIVGGDNPDCRNIKLLYPVLSALSPNKLKQVKITVIGFSKPEVPEHLKNVFELKGRCSYQELYQTLRSCYAVLMLLDPENKAHLRYCSGVVSGNINLSFGFRRPVIIESTFARYYDATDKNSFIYKGNRELHQAIDRALEISPADYISMRKVLDDDARRKYDQSLNILKKLLKVDKKPLNL